MYRVVDQFVELLSSSPGAVLPGPSIGAKRPSNGAEIPAIAVSLTVESSRATGLGRFIRSGEVTAQNIAVVEVIATPDTFSSDLRTLRIAPLPLRRNPSSTSEDFGDQDVMIRNVTNIGNPIMYRMTDHPSGYDEYRVDVEEAQISFGKPQKAGDKLEVTHWTVTWRDDITGDRYNGVLNVEIWAASLSQADGISRNLQDRVETNGASLRQRGFMKLQPASLDATESLLYQPPSGSPFQVWRQRMSYRFTFESEVGGETSSGVPIKRIGVDIKRPRDSFSIP